MVAVTVGELVAYLRLDNSGFARDLGSAQATMRAAAASARAMLGEIGDGRSWKSFSANADRAAAAAARTAATLALIPAAAGTINVAAAGVSAAAGAIALLPAAAAAAGAGVATLAVGMKGFGEALKSSGDPQKFAAALENLSPNARAAAVAVHSMRGSWKDLQSSVQDTLFAGIAESLKDLGGTYIPVLRSGLTGIAAGFNAAAKGTMDWLGQARQVATINGIMDGARATTTNLSAALQPITQIFVDIAAVGSTMLPQLTSGFGAAAQRAADFVTAARESGQLQAWIKTSLATLSTLGQLLANIGSIAAAVFQGLSSQGGSLLDTLVQLTGTVREWLQSFEGQQVLQSVGTALHTIGQVVNTVLMTALRELGPVVQQLLPAFAALAASAGGTLVAGLQVLGPLLQGMALWLQENASWLGPLAVGIYGVVKAFEVMRIGIMALNVLLAANPFMIIVTTLALVVALVLGYWDEIKAGISAAWDWLSATAESVWNTIKDYIVNPLTTAAQWVGRRIQDVLNFFSWLSALPGRAAEWFGGVLRSARDKLNEVADWVRGIPDRILGALGNLGNLLWNAGKSIIQGLWNGLKSLWESVKSWISGIGDWISRNKGPLSYDRQLLVPAGKAIMQGLLAGMQSEQSRIVGFLHALTDTINVAGSPQLALSGVGSSTVTGIPPTLAGNSGSALTIENAYFDRNHSPTDIARELDWQLRTSGRR